MMKSKYLLWFSDKIQIDKAELKGWNLLAKPDAEEFWSSENEKFEDATVVFLLVEKEERGRIMPAAHAVLKKTPDVRLLQIAADSQVTPVMLENASKMPEELLDIDEEDFAALADVKTVTAMHPSQDYMESTFYYGTKIQGREYLISSNQEMIPFQACADRQITLMRSHLSMSGFSHSSVLDYFSGAAQVTPNALHADIAAYIQKHIYFSTPEIYDFIAVWIMGTYLFRAFRYYPYLHLNAEKGSGKTLLMELMEPIAFNGVLLAQPPASTVLKLIEQDSASLFIDEAEGLGSKSSSSQLKSILKTGFARSGVYYSGDNMYRTYSPKCFAGINMLDDVLADRTITVRLLRKTGYDTTAIYRETPLMRKLQSELRDRLYLFGLQYGVGIAEDYNAETPLYDKFLHLTNRAYDIWLPLFKIVYSFDEGRDKTRILESLDKLSQADTRRRVIRDAEENETGMAVAMMDEVLPHIRPLEVTGEISYYDPDAVYLALQRGELIPKSMQKKGLSRMLKRALDIDSMPRSFGDGTKRMYAVDAKKLESYRKRYADVVV